MQMHDNVKTEHTTMYMCWLENTLSGKMKWGKSHYGIRSFYKGYQIDITKRCADTYEVDIYETASMLLFLRIPTGTSVHLVVDGKADTSAIFGIYTHIINKHLAENDKNKNQILSVLSSSSRD
jgi:hypothetical protein